MVPDAEKAETPDRVYLREHLSPLIYANDHDGAIEFVAGLMGLARNAPWIETPLTKPAGIYTAGQDTETDEAVATLRHWKARIRREALIEAARHLEARWTDPSEDSDEARTIRECARVLRVLAESFPTPDDPGHSDPARKDA